MTQARHDIERAALVYPVLGCYRTPVEKALNMFKASGGEATGRGTDYSLQRATDALKGAFCPWKRRQRIQMDAKGFSYQILRSLRASGLASHAHHGDYTCPKNVCLSSRVAFHPLRSARSDLVHEVSGVDNPVKRPFPRERYTMATHAFSSSSIASSCKIVAEECFFHLPCSLSTFLCT